jgi:hypothetical protein
MPARRVWTAAQDRALLEMRAAGRTWDACGWALGVSRNAVIGRVDRLKHRGAVFYAPPPPTPTPVREDRPALCAGHPLSWGLLTAGTVLEGAAYPFPVFADRADRCGRQGRDATGGYRVRMGLGA